MFYQSRALINCHQHHLTRRPPASIFEGVGNLLRGSGWEATEVVEMLSRFEFLERVDANMRELGSDELCAASLNGKTVWVKNEFGQAAKSEIARLIEEVGADPHDEIMLVWCLRTDVITASVQIKYKTVHRKQQSAMELLVGMVPRAVARIPGENDGDYVRRMTHGRFPSEPIVRAEAEMLVEKIIAALPGEPEVVRVHHGSVATKRGTAPAVLAAFGGALCGLDAQIDLAYLGLMAQIGNERRDPQNSASSGYVYDSTGNYYAHAGHWLDRDSDAGFGSNPTGDSDVGAPYQMIPQDFLDYANDVIDSANASIDASGWDSNFDQSSSDSSSDGGSDGGGGDSGGGDGGGGCGGGGCGGGGD